MRSLEDLYAATGELFAKADIPRAGLDWTDRVLPYMLDACRLAAIDGAPEIFALWRNWISSDGIEGIRDAGEPEAFEWRRDWCRCLFTGAQMLRQGAAQADVASKLHAEATAPFLLLPMAFWLDLAEALSGPPRPVRMSNLSLAFPLVLSDRMIIDGESTDVVLAEFQFEPTSYTEERVLYPDPEQISLSCFDRSFLEAFAHAAAAAGAGGRDAAPGARVRLIARRPEHRVILEKLVLRGPSGGGALAMGFYALRRGLTSLDPDLAISFAVTAPGQTTPDGRCHAIGGAFEKVRGCARNAIRQLVVSNEQDSQVTFYGHVQNVTITGVRTIDDAVEIIAASPAPLPAAPRSEAQDDCDGVLPLDSQLYVERESDLAFQAALSARPMIVLLKGPRQIGKTSLFVRGVAQTRKQHTKLVYIDLHGLGKSDLKSQRDLFTSFARVFARELALDVTLDDIYDEREGPNKNFEHYLTRHALRTPIVWFMDAVDRLFEFDYYTDVFSLMRSWHNRRPVHPELSNLTLVLSYATETHLMIEDPYQSPFNVGVKVELEDFSAAQISTLNDRLQQPIQGAEQMRRFHELVGGHPYLVCRGLSWMRFGEKSLEEFVALCATDRGPFGDHLHRMLRLARNSEHLQAVQNVLSGQPCRNHDAFLHLRSAGVIIGDDMQDARMRCEIYASYLQRHLEPIDQKSSTANWSFASAWRQIRRRK